MLFFSKLHAQKIDYPQPIPTTSISRQLIWIHNSRYDCPQLTDRDMAKGVSVGSKSTPAPVSTYANRYSTTTSHNFCCDTVLATVNYDWSTSNRSFIFEQVKLSSIPPSGKLGTMFIRRKEANPWTYYWNIAINSALQLQISADGITTAILTFDPAPEVGKTYQLGIALDRTNNRIRAALTEYATHQRSEVDIAAPGDWVGKNFGGSDASAFPSVGGWCTHTSQTSTSSTFHGEIGNITMYSTAWDMELL